jgi:hypothetical protein
MAVKTAARRGPAWAGEAGLLILATLTCAGTARAVEGEPDPTQDPPDAVPTDAPGTDPAPPAGPSEADLDLASLQAELGGADLSSLDSGGPKLGLYGFADFTYTVQVGKVSFAAPWYPTFAVGNFNLYLSTEFTPTWRSLAEVRFLYLPNGQLEGGELAGRNPDGVRVNTSSADYADVNRPLRWGGVEIERIWLEHTFSNLLTLRVGQWLTPYGVWNVDHGSPAIIGVFRPYIVGEALFPERQTGIEGYGSFYVDATQVGYHLTLSNGRGPIDAYQDLDHNKGIGARLFVRNDSLLGTFTLGASGYRGRFSDRPDNPIQFGPDGLTLSKVLTSRYEELALAADLKWEWEELLLQSEVVVSDQAYPNELRPAGFSIPGQPLGFVADNRRKGFYVLAAYRTPWWNIMPFVVWQMYKNPLVTDANEIQLGLNMRVMPEIVVKAQFNHVWFPDGFLDNIDYVTTQAAWSF